MNLNNCSIGDKIKLDIGTEINRYVQHYGLTKMVVGKIPVGLTTNILDRGIISSEAEVMKIAKGQVTLKVGYPCQKEVSKSESAWKKNPHRSPIYIGHKKVVIKKSENPHLWK